MKASVIVLVQVGALALSAGYAQAANCSASVANKIGDTISVTGMLSTEDPNENGEGEPLLLSSSGGEFTAVISAYFVPQTFTYTATTANETISGTIIGFDFDESCTITASFNQPHFLSQAQKNFFSGAAAGLAVPAGGFWTVSELCALSIIGGPICAIPSGLAAAGFATAAALAGLISLDPPDPNFTQIVTPVIPVIPVVGPQPGVPQAVIDAFNVLLDNQAHVVGVERALYITLNRASGAFEAGDSFWMDKQVAAANQFIGQLGPLFSAEARALIAVQGAMTAAGIDVTITPNDVFRFESKVAFGGGLPAADIAALQQFGADQPLIDYVRNLMIVQDINAVAGPVSGLLAPPSLITLLNSLGVGPPTDKAECKDGGWQTFTLPKAFKNQGDCIQFVNTGK